MGRGPRITLPQDSEGERTGTDGASPAMASIAATRDESQTGSMTEASTRSETPDLGFSEEGRISTRTRSRRRVANGGLPVATLLNHPPGNSESDSGFEHTPLHTAATDPASIPNTDVENRASGNPLPVHRIGCRNKHPRGGHDSGDLLRPTRRGYAPSGLRNKHDFRSGGYATRYQS